MGSDSKVLPIQKLKFDQLASLNTQMTEQDRSTRTLAVDIGGSGIKVMVLDDEGKPQTERSRLETPQPPKPEPVLEAIASLASGQGEFDRVSVGFPGVVSGGFIKTAANLDPSWIDFDLQTTLKDRLGKPVRVANDADIQGLGAIAGTGVELVITLGTGFRFCLICRWYLGAKSRIRTSPVSQRGKLRTAIRAIGIRYSRF